MHSVARCGTLVAYSFTRHLLVKLIFGLFQAHEVSKVNFLYLPECSLCVLCRERVQGDVIGQAGTKKRVSTSSRFNIHSHKNNKNLCPVSVTKPIPAVQIRQHAAPCPLPPCSARRSGRRLAQTGNRNDESVPPLHHRSYLPFHLRVTTRPYKLIKLHIVFSSLTH
jgi:hypothetical protein